VASSEVGVRFLSPLYQDSRVGPERCRIPARNTNEFQWLIRSGRSSLLSPFCRPQVPCAVQRRPLQSLMPRWKVNHSGGWIDQRDLRLTSKATAMRCRNCCVGQAAAKLSSPGMVHSRLPSPRSMLGPAAPARPDWSTAIPKSATTTLLLDPPIERYRVISESRHPK
jgi:hypothetical protein